MPGISFVAQLGHRSRLPEPAIVAALSTLVHDEHYASRELLKSASWYLGWSAYAAYPLESIRVGDVSVFLEGRLYGQDSATRRNKLAALARFVSDDAPNERIAEWLQDADGDFVACAIDTKAHRMMIVNDLLGRLPLYYYRAPDALILSRELRFIAHLLDPLRFDRMAIAQHLLIGYPLGSRTLLDGVGWLAPATCVRIDTGEMVMTRLHALSFDAERDNSRSVEANAEELVARFTSACADRAADRRPLVVSLSGGFDSRAIAAGFHKLGIPFRAATFLDHKGHATADVRVAAQLATLFQCEWKSMQLGPPEDGDVLRLLRMKSGMNPLGMSFLLSFLRAIRDEHGSDAYLLTGELGTCTLPAVAPTATLRSVHNLVDSLIHQYGKLPLAVVAALTQLDAGDIISELDRLVLSYPEDEWARKFVHFVVSERALKWCAEGEDRNRCYCWTTTPFSALRFFDDAMHCPQEQKRDFRLYRDFLLRLSPRAAAVEHAGMGAAITADQFRIDAKVLTLLEQRPELRRRLTTVLRPSVGYGSRSRVPNLMRRQLARADAISAYLSADALAQVLDHAEGYGTEALDLLFTISSLIEELTTGTSVLEACAPCT